MDDVYDNFRLRVPQVLPYLWPVNKMQNVLGISTVIWMQTIKQLP